MADDPGKWYMFSKYGKTFRVIAFFLQLQSMLECQHGQDNLPHILAADPVCI
jgi:hypothetical protein